MKNTKHRNDRQPADQHPAAQFAVIAARVVAGL